MVGIVTKLRAVGADREEARKGANLLDLAESVDHAGLFLAKPNGERVSIELPSAVLDALRMVLARMAENEEVLLLSEETELTPEQAAKVLGVSRPIVYHRMDSGRLPYREVGTHRRVLLKDVLELRAFEDRRRNFSEQLAADTDELETNYAHSPESSS